MQGDERREEKALEEGVTPDVTPYVPADVYRSRALHGIVRGMRTGSGAPSERKASTKKAMSVRTPDAPPPSGFAFPGEMTSHHVALLVEACLDHLADRVAAKLAEQRCPAPYSQDNPPPGMTRRAYLDAAGRRDFPTSKAGRAVLCDRRDFEAYLSARKREVSPREGTSKEGHLVGSTLAITPVPGGDEIDAIMARSGTVRRPRKA